MEPAISSRGSGRDASAHASSVDRSERWALAGQRGGTVLITGLPASGKSTIAGALERRLVDEGHAAYLLDGDGIREGLSSDLGFSASDRSENIRRVGHVARLFADCGVIAVMSLISPLAEDRAEVRRAHLKADLTFVEVFVDTPVEDCERRDPKGLYARARAGKLRNFTGVDAPYEAPVRPDVWVKTDEMSVADATDEIISVLNLAS